MIDCISRLPGRSVRRGCRVLGFRRQTFYSRKSGNRPEERDDELTELLRRTCSIFVAWGFWLVFHYLRNEYGLQDNHKRAYRLWKQAGLHLRTTPKRPKIRREYQELLAPSHVNEGWAMDFLSDWVIGPQKQSARIINVIDECSRRALWTTAHTSISATKLISVLDRLVAWRGAPAYIRCDNGPEFIANRLKAWADRHGIDLRYIQPGKPSQNGIIERLNKTLRAECLDLHWFQSFTELNQRIQDWSVVYNHVRPHSSIGYKPPLAYENSKEKFYFRAVAA